MKAFFWHKEKKTGEVLVYFNKGVLSLMMFKTLLAKMGKGGAQTDLILEKDRVHLGDQVKGKLLVRGGIIDQEIHQIATDLMIHIRMEQQVHSYSIASFPFHSPCSVRPSEEITFPFSFRLPANLLVSGYTVSYQFVTRLEVGTGEKYTKTDPVIITPPRSFQPLLNALEQLGFHEKYGSRSYDGKMQTFEFNPTAFLKKKVRELEMAVAIGKETVYMLVQLPSLAACREIKLKREWFNQPERLKNFLQASLWEMVYYPEHCQQSKEMFYKKYCSLPGSIGAFAGEWSEHYEYPDWVINQKKA